MPHLEEYLENEGIMITYPFASGIMVILPDLEEYLVLVLNTCEGMCEIWKNIWKMSRGNMGRCFNTGGWYFCQIIDVEIPSNALDILKKHHGIANFEQLRLGEI